MPFFDRKLKKLFTDFYRFHDLFSRDLTNLKTNANLILVKVNKNFVNFRFLIRNLT